MIHYNEDNEQSAKYIDKLCSLLIDILLQEGITNDYRIRQSQQRNSEPGAAKEGNQ